MISKSGRPRGNARRFHSLFEEIRSLNSISFVTDRMREIILNDVIEHDLVYKGFIEPYLTIVDAMEMFTSALFKLCPEGIARFEITRENGLKMLFKTNLSSEGTIFTMIDIAWIYGKSVEDVIEENLNRSNSTLNQMACSYAH